MLAVKVVYEERLCEKCSVVKKGEAAIVLSKTGSYWLAVARKSLR